MPIDQSEVSKALAEAIKAISACSSIEESKQVKIDFIGDKSPIAKLNQSLGKLDPSSRAEFGKAIGVGDVTFGIVQEDLGSRNLNIIKNDPSWKGKGMMKGKDQGKGLP